MKGCPYISAYRTLFSKCSITAILTIVLQYTDTSLIIGRAVSSRAGKAGRCVSS